MPLEDLLKKSEKKTFEKKVRVPTPKKSKILSDAELLKALWGQDIAMLRTLMRKFGLKNFSNLRNKKQYVEALK